MYPAQKIRGAPECRESFFHSVSNAEQIFVVSCRGFDRIPLATSKERGEYSMLFVKVLVAVTMVSAILGLGACSHKPPPIPPAPATIGTAK